MSKTIEITIGSNRNSKSVEISTIEGLIQVVMLDSTGTEIDSLFCNFEILDRITAAKAIKDHLEGIEISPIMNALHKIVYAATK